MFKQWNLEYRVNSEVRHEHDEEGEEIFIIDELDFEITVDKIKILRPQDWIK